MSEILLNYLNKEVKLSKKIESIEIDFKNGYYFAELLSNTNFLILNNLSLFNPNAKTKQEIMFNFILLRDDLANLGIHLDDITINELANNSKGKIPNLLYKIKTQIDRKKIKFDDIMAKLIGKQNEEKKEKMKENKFNKTSYGTKSDFNKNNKLPEITYMSTFYGTNTNFNSVKRKSIVSPELNYNKLEKNMKFPENNKYVSERILNETKLNKKRLEPLSSNNLNYMPLIPNSFKPKLINNTNFSSLKKRLPSEKINQLDEIEEKPDSELNQNSKLYQQQQKKFKSHGKNEQKIKVFSEKYFENNNKYMKYSCFDRNTLKLGIDLKETDSKLYKLGIGYNNDYIPTSIIYDRLKKKVNQKEEEYKKQLEEKRFMTEEERYLKNSILSQNKKNQNGKKFEINFNKDSHLYKMHEYEKYRKEAFPFKEKINKKLLYIKSDDDEFNLMTKGYATTTDNFYTKTIMTNFSNEFNKKKDNEEFNEYEFFEELEKDTLTQRKRNAEYKSKIRKKNYNKINKIVNLILDLANECFYLQKKKNAELLEIPEFNSLINNFIKGKINLSRPNKNNNSLINLEDDNLLKNDTEKEQNYINNEKYISEYNDYIFYRGLWTENKFIPRKFYGSQLHVYQVLGEDINFLTSSGRMVTQGIKPNILLKMKNEEFELKESEKDNIILPKENSKNRLFGEIIELNFDNLPNNYCMNIINNNLGISNIKGNENNMKLNFKKNFFSQDITYNNTNNDDTLYTNEKDLVKINSSIINNSNMKLQNNLINNDLNISGVKQDANKSNTSFDEVLFNNTTNNNINIANNNINNNNNLNQNNENDFSHIPIKICLIGHSFSGRKTQAKLLCNKYPKLKYYSLENIINDYFSEYERLHTPIENNPKQKNIKKNQLEQLKNQRIEELKQYENIFKILEPFIKDNKKNSDLSDEAKINILIQQIKKDFPIKGGDIYQEISKRNLRKQNIENELERLKEEFEKKKKLGTKEIKEQQLLEKELEDLMKEGFYGFILVDFPNNYNQYTLFENVLTGFVQQIDKEENMRDKYMELLTFSIDKPYANISHLCPEVINYLGFGNKNLSKSFFNNYIWLEIDEEETLKRVNDRLIDETTNIIYHKEFNPPPQGDKKLLERLKPVNEPTEVDIKNELKKYDIEFPKILSYISLFHNLKKISKINKNDVFIEIDEILSNNVKKFEDREIKDEIAELNNFDPDESENIKYLKKLNEVKKKVNKEISGSIISSWSECLNKYSKGVKEFLYNFSSLKHNILDKMDIMQEIFIKYLNDESQKKKLVTLFQKKYESFIDKYNNLKKKNIVKEEFQKDVVELTEHFWEIIQMKKRDAIKELKNLKEQNFLENQSELFWKYLSQLFLMETNFYIKKLNLIRKYYYEFEGNKYSEKCPYVYDLNENDILSGLNDYIIFNKNYDENKNTKTEKKKKSNIKNSKQNESTINMNNKEISPRIDNIFKNCFKFLFYYDKKINEIIKNEKEKYALNSSNISGIQKRKHRKKITDGKTEPSIFSESKMIISYEDEMKAALNNEKIKYKIRISLLKFFGEKFLIEANNITDKTFKNLDNSIIKSVDAQNTAMNELMEKIKRDIIDGKNKITFNIELDVFDIYHKLYIPFKQFILDSYNSSENPDKKISVTELNKIYLDLKNYEIQDNYVTFNSVIDIVFKKHLFELKSNAFVKYLKTLPYHYLNNLIKKFIIKSSAGQNLIRIDRLFTILSIIYLNPPKNSEKKEILEEASNKLKFHCFLSKEDFLNINFWFEKEDKNNSITFSKIDSNSSINNLNYYKSNKINQRINLFELNSNETNVIKEENYDKKENGNEITNLDVYDDNYILLKEDININSETKQQMNYLFKNLTVRSSGRMKSRKTPKKMGKYGSSPLKVVNEELKLKEFLFNINKNYDNQINFIEFMNVVSLQFLKNKNQKNKYNKFINIHAILDLAKHGQLEQNIYHTNNNLMKTKCHNFSRKTTQFIATKKEFNIEYHKSPSLKSNNAQIFDKKMEKENHNKRVYIGGDEEINIFKEGDYLIINDKKYNINNLNDNAYVETTYLDEIIDDRY